MNTERGVSGGVVFQGAISYAKYLSDHAAVAPGTAKAYARIMKSMNGKDIIPDIEKASGFCKKRNRYYVRAALVKYLDYLVYSKQIPDSRKREILDAVPKAKEVPVKPRTLTSIDDMKRILDSMEPDDRMVARFLFYTGCRIGEALTVCLKEIDFKTGMVTVWGKGRMEKHPRAVKLPMDYLKELKKISGDLGILDGEFIFYPNNMGSLDTRIHKFNVAFEKACMKTIGKTLGSHEFRRMAGTFLYEQTHDIQLVRKILGHNNVDTTLVYTQYADSETNLDKARDVLGRVDLIGKKESRKLG